MMKRTKQTQCMVDAANQLFRAEHITDENSEDFWLANYLLMSTGTWKGFSWYKRVYCEEVGSEIVSRCSKEDAEYIQLI